MAERSVTLRHLATAPTADAHETVIYADARGVLSQRIGTGDPANVGGASTAADISTDAVDGETTVQGALEALAAASGGVSAASKALSNAQIKALHTTPVEIVAAQANKIIVPVAAQLVVIAGATPFTGTDVEVAIAHGSNGAGSEDALLLTAGNTSFLGFGGVTWFVDSGTPEAPTGWDLATAIGTNLAIQTNGALTDGDGTAVVHVQYIVVDAV